MKIVKIHRSDNVGIAVRLLRKGEKVEGVDPSVKLQQDIPRCHKVALVDIPANEPVYKYGYAIGHATRVTTAGSWVHSHNLATNLAREVTYKYRPVHEALRAEARSFFAESGVARNAFIPRTQPSSLSELRRSRSPGSSAKTDKTSYRLNAQTFKGFKRDNGKTGTRNDIWIISTVGCISGFAERLALRAKSEFRLKNCDGIFALTHPYGCSQLAGDLESTQRILAGLAQHPNAGGVLIVGLGCENNQLKDQLERIGYHAKGRLKFFNLQDVKDEMSAGLKAIGSLVSRAENDRRSDCPVSDLVLGMKCGGSDALSGITANPLAGRVSDRLIAMSGSVILSEVPEMFGAEQILMNRAASRKVYNDVVTMIRNFKSYFTAHGQPVYENPSPGNKAGGITTLEEKSLGAILKGGTARIARVLQYGEVSKGKGLMLLNAPGNDGVASTAIIASGATVLLFTTGMGTPMGFPVPTVKISSSSNLAAAKPGWIDFDAGKILSGASWEDLTDDLFGLVLDVASGRKMTRNETSGERSIAIWKNGVTL